MSYQEKISKDHKGTTKKKISDLTFEEFQNTVLMREQSYVQVRNTYDRYI